MFARPLLRGQRATLGEQLEVALDRRTVDPEPTGGLAFGDALPYRLYYLGAQIYRIGFHASMMLGGATSLQAAIGIDTSESLIASHQEGTTCTYAFLGSWGLQGRLRSWGLNVTTLV